MPACQHGSRPWHLVAALATATLLLGPVAAVWFLDQPWGAGAGSSSLPIRYAPLGASIAVAGCASVLAVGIGAGLAAVIELTRLPGRRLWITLAMLPLICPPMVWALGQWYTFGPGGALERRLGSSWHAVGQYSDPGHYTVTVLVLAEIHAPWAMLLVARGLRRLHQAGLSAARLFLSPFALLRWTAVAAKRELGAAVLLCFVLALGNHAIPHVFQCRLYPVEIYLRMTNYLDSAGALVAGVPLLLSALAPVIGLVAFPWRSQPVLAGPSYSDSLPLSGRMGILAFGLGIYLTLTTVVPVAVLVEECQSPKLFLDAMRGASREAGNSLALAGVTAGIAALAGLATGLSSRPSRLIQCLTVIPLGLAPILLGLSYVQAYNRPGLSELAVIAGVNVPLVLAMTCRAWPFASRLVRLGNERVAPEWVEAARLAGLGRFARWRWVTGPLLAESVAAAALVGYLLALADVEITQMLAAPGSGTLALRLFAFLHFGPQHVAASLALGQMLLAIMPVLLYDFLFKRPFEAI